MAKLNTSLKITLIVAIIVLALGAIAIPIILFTNANSDTNPTLNDDSSQTSNQDVSTSNSTNPNNPETNPTEDLARIQEELRDQQRQRDIATLKAAITQFQVNNNGKLPGQGSNLDGQGELVYQPSQDHTLPSTSDGVVAKLINYYLNSISDSENYFIDPDGWTYGLTIIDYDHYKDLPEKNATHMIYLLHQTNCNATTDISHSDKPRDFAILYRLENGSLYCLDNQ